MFVPPPAPSCWGSGRCLVMDSCQHAQLRTRPKMLGSFGDVLASVGGGVWGQKAETGQDSAAPWLVSQLVCPSVLPSSICLWAVAVFMGHRLWWPVYPHRLFQQRDPTARHGEQFHPRTSTGPSLLTPEVGDQLGRVNDCSTHMLTHTHDSVHAHCTHSYVLMHHRTVFTHHTHGCVHTQTQMALTHVARCLLMGTGLVTPLT